jgi:hypothetical protein
VVCHTSRDRQGRGAAGSPSFALHGERCRQRRCSQAARLLEPLASMSSVRHTWGEAGGLRATPAVGWASPPTTNSARPMVVVTGPLLPPTKRTTGSRDAPAQPVTTPLAPFTNPGVFWQAADSTGCYSVKVMNSQSMGSSPWKARRSHVCCCACELTSALVDSLEEDDLCPNLERQPLSRRTCHGTPCTPTDSSQDRPGVKFTTRNCTVNVSPCRNKPVLHGGVHPSFNSLICHWPPESLAV